MGGRHPLPQVLKFLVLRDLLLSAKTEKLIVAGAVCQVGGVGVDDLTSCYVLKKRSFT